jgi:RecA/RadA recombinase
MNKEERLLKLKNLMKDINKGHDNIVLDFASNQESWVVANSGVPIFDDFCGGFPYGHTSIVWGGSGAGKSSLMYATMAQAQREGKIVAFLDLENSYSNERASLFGVKTDELIIGHYEVAEQALDTVITLAKEKAVDMIILDSLHSMAPKGELEDKKGQKSLENDTMALLARKLAQFFRMASTLIYNANISFIMVGQTRTDLGGFIALQKLSGGNCFDCGTRVLTKEGLKGIDEINEGDLIPTVNFTKECVEYQPITKKFIYDYNDKLIEFKNKYSKHFLFTPNHQCLVKTFKNGSLNKPYYQTQLAIDERRTMAFPVCYPSGNTDYNISDHNLKALAWCLTDSTIQKADQEATKWKKFANKIVIYQTKHAEHVEQVLSQSDFKYKKTVRIRKETRKAFKNAKPSSEFYLYNAKEILDKYELTNNKFLPNWMFNLSDRQVKLFMNEIMLADGTISLKGFFRCLTKGNKEYLEKIAQLCVTHNIPVSHIKKSKLKECWILLFQYYDYVGFKKHQVKQIPYTGRVWDILVPNHYHWIERNGQLILTHNSLIHSSVLTVYMRRGQKSNAPILSWKEAYIDPDGKFHLITKKEPVGFEVVAKIDKKKTNQGKPEGSEVSFPYYLETGFVAPDSEGDIIKIAPEMIGEQKEECRKILVERGYTQFDKEPRHDVGKELDELLKDVSETVDKLPDEENKELPIIEEKPKKRRGRPKKNADTP